MIVKKVNAFTDDIKGGNPAGVVVNSPELTDIQMTKISKILSVSETAFVFQSSIADYKIRFFSPTIEVDLCGHATIASFFLMAKEGLIKQKETITEVKQETKVGILPIDIFFKNNNVEKVMMTQNKPIIKNKNFDWKIIADSLNIKESYIDQTLPKQISSTGLFTLPICVKSFEILKSIKPNFEKVSKISMDLNIGSFHVFTFDTIEKNSLYHARNFPPLYGIYEDPVTGTANGALCSYLHKNGLIDDKNIICEQGDIIGRSGRVYVDLSNDFVKVGGRAKIIEEREINIG